MTTTKVLTTIRRVILSVYGSADPNLFGSKDRRRWKGDLAGEFKSMANNTQNEIDALKSMNPFEGAAAKSVMKKATLGARQFQTRAFNLMGANATPEAIVASQQAASEALGAAAGQIAAGAEANQINQINALRGLKQNQMGAYGSMKMDSINERGSGWQSFFNNIDAMGSIASGIGQAAGKLF